MPAPDYTKQHQGNENLHILYLQILEWMNGNMLQTYS